MLNIKNNKNVYIFNGYIGLILLQFKNEINMYNIKPYACQFNVKSKLY